MVTLHIHMADGGLKSFSLEPGVYGIGRGAENAIVIDDPTVSENHAEFTAWEDGQMLVRDLGSANQALVNGRVAADTFLRAGDVIRLGNAVIRVESAPTPAAAAPAATIEHESASGVQSYFGALGQSFVYPFKGDAILMIGILAIVNTVCALLPAPLGVIGILVSLGASIYFLQVFRQIILATADGQDNVPDMPALGMDFGELRETIVPIYCLVFLSFAPLVFMRMYPGTPKWLPWAWIGLVVAYLPMGLLLLVKTGEFIAANPWTAALSILKAPLGYCAIMVFMGGLVAGGMLLAPLGELLPKAGRFVGIAVEMLVSVAQTYLAFVLARMLGLFYRHHEDKLSWSA